MDDLLPGDRIHGFPGGLKLEHHKAVACERPVARPPMPERLFIQVVQHQGESGRIVVEPGEWVAKGQALTAAGDDFIVPEHTPSSGTIEAITDHPAAFPPGGTQQAIVLVPDGRDEWTERNPLSDWRNASGTAIVDHLHRAGMAGLGGAMFPTAAKLRGDWPGIHSVILNGAECEPWIACDEMLMRERPRDVIEGGLILARAAGAERVVIAIEDRMGAVEAKLREARRELDAERNVRIRKVFTVYPEGGERQIIQALTGREVPHDGLPQDLGVIVHNVGTAATARDAVVEGRPLIERIVTVTGPGIAEPRNLLALVGTPFNHLVETAGGYRGEVTRLILGGPMSGTALASDEIPVTKGSNCVLALTDNETAPTQPTLPCINCGECVRVCPARLLPQTLFRLIEAENYDAAADYDLPDCIECGCCAAVCPSHIPLVDYYKHGKDELTRRRLDRRRAALAKRRYEAREERLRREKEERQARRKEREEKLKRPEEAQDEIQAAIERAKRNKKT
ncbi:MULTISPECIES: electron transport complex subunit RsxC [unclassified Wenzhouxiangella]|uniref:electron transport complex subunit RsxC n=1 Tax=unclassified Wenzhouxiangella TaxID=2613841 RepID=UPI000E32BEC0|nr:MULTISPECIES: electron transport complex subunit RsxC [unclassified Wenzhouxiangella]RFF28944.1 electron transport complex subunit RsxC [Wenzhouxiangella sp. 15181]RFP68347.1 electron transport complex subunit RsxC [Wenzhouxiangella sp. 15190]